MKKIVFALALFIAAFTLKVESQSTASYGMLLSSLSTASTGAVTGTSYALPQGYASIITWSVTADGSALSVNLEGSQDNSVWTIIDSQTTAAGGIRNYGFTSIKFFRISQVSRTGGTLTTGSVLTSRGFITTAGGGSSGTFSSTTFKATGGTITDPGYGFSDLSAYGMGHDGSSLRLIAAGASRMILNSNGIAVPIGSIAGNSVAVGDGTQLLPSIAWTSQLNTGIFKAAANDVSISSNGSRNFAFSGDDLYMLGATTPMMFWSTTLFAALGTPANGAFAYCSDCLIQAVCAGAGTGAFAKRLNGVWVCN